MRSAVRLLAKRLMPGKHILKAQERVFPAALTTLSVTHWDTTGEVRIKVGSHPGRLAART